MAGLLECVNKKALAPRDGIGAGTLLSSLPERFNRAALGAPVLPLRWAARPPRGAASLQQNHVCQSMVPERSAFGGATTTGALS